MLLGHELNCLFLSSLGPGQVRVRKVRASESGRVQLRELETRKDLDLSHTGFHHSPPPQPVTFSWLLRSLDKSDGPKMGWYDSGMMIGG